MTSQPRAAWVVLAVCGAARLALSIGTEIYPDEAYYWVWSKHLELSYFDHPALIAWSIAALGIRTAAMAFGIATLFGVYRLTRALEGDHQTGLWATALFASTPAASLLGTVATPDAPLLCFWVWALVAVMARRTWAIGLLWGLAMLSKYNGLLLGIPIALSLWKRPLHLVAAGLVALAVTSPTIVWNAQHDWEGFRFQLDHGLGGGGGWSTFLEFVGGQFVMAGPIALVLMIAGAIALRRSTVLVAAMAVPVVVFGYASLKARGEANWSSAAWLSGSVIAALIPWNRVRLAAIAVNLALLIGGTVFLIAPPASTWGTPVIQKLHGWAALERAKEEHVPVFTSRYQTSALVTLYTGLEASTWGGRRSQFDLWPRPSLAPGSNALWIGEWDGPPPAFYEAFEAVEPLDWQFDDRQRAHHTFYGFRLVRLKTTLPLP